MYTRREEERARVIAQLENSKRDLEVDERANDSAWTVPKSMLFQDAAIMFSLPLLKKCVPLASVASLAADTDSDHDESTSGSLASSELSGIPSDLHTIRYQKWKRRRNQVIVDHAHRLIHSFQRSHSSNHMVRQSSTNTSVANTPNRSWLEISFFQSEDTWSYTSALLFHPFEPLLYAADNTSYVAAWNYGTNLPGQFVDQELLHPVTDRDKLTTGTNYTSKQRANRFNNENPRKSQTVTSVSLLACIIASLL